MIRWLDHSHRGHDGWIIKWILCSDSKNQLAGGKLESERPQMICVQTRHENIEYKHVGLRRDNYRLRSMAT
jgi:hypothetical protein